MFRSALSMPISTPVQPARAMSASTSRSRCAGCAVHVHHTGCARLASEPRTARACGRRPDRERIVEEAEPAQAEARDEQLDLGGHRRGAADSETCDRSRRSSRTCTPAGNRGSTRCRRARSVPDRGRAAAPYQRGSNEHRAPTAAAPADRVYSIKHSRASGCGGPVPRSSHDSPTPIDSHAAARSGQLIVIASASSTSESSASPRIT